MTKKALSEMTYEERMKDSSLSWFQRLYGQTEDEVKNKLLHAMHELNVHRIEAEYSGGHDEGGVQELRAWEKNGDEVDGGADWQDPLWEACNDVLSTKFFSWALGYSVEGVLHVNLAEKRIWTEGHMEQLVDDDDPLDWKW